MPEIREVIDMNLNAAMRKLQRAILVRTGLVVKIGTSQFHSKDQNRMITMYSLTTPVLQENRRGQWRMKDYESIRTASQIDIVMTLREIWTQLEGWA